VFNEEDDFEAKWKRVDAQIEEQKRLYLKSLEQKPEVKVQEKIHKKDKKHKKDRKHKKKHNGAAKKEENSVAAKHQLIADTFAKKTSQVKENLTNINVNLWNEWKNFQTRL